MKRILNVLLVTFVIATSCKNNTLSFEQYKKQGDELYYQKDYIASLSMYLKAVELKGNMFDQFTDAYNSGLLKGKEELVASHLKIYLAAEEASDKTTKDNEMAQKLNSIVNYDIKEQAVDEEEFSLISVRSRLEHYVITHRLDSIIDLAAEQRKSQSFSDSILISLNSFDSLIRVNGVTSIDELRKSNSTSVQIINGRTLKSYSNTYGYKHEPFGSKTDILQDKPICSELKVEFEERDSRFYVKQVYYYSNIWTKNYKVAEFIQSFFGDTATFRSSLVYIDKLGKTIVKDKIASSEIEEYLLKVKPQFTIQKNIEEAATGEFYSVIFQKNNNTKFSFTEPFTSLPQYLFLQIIFQEGTDSIYISNGKKYAFYSVKDMNTLLGIVRSILSSKN